MVKIKICGITNLNDAQAAVEAGCDMLGFVFYEKSPRYIKPKKVKEIIDNVPDHIEKVALFVNEPKENVHEVLDELKGITMLQFHGNETPDYCNGFNKRVIKALRVKNEYSLEDAQFYKVNFLLLDTFKEGAYGGTGDQFNWGIARDFKARSSVPIILSGGLRPENVKGAIEKVDPYAVDVSSGVEISPGRKDPELIKKFIEQVKEKNA